MDPSELTPQQGFQNWWDLMETSHQLLLAGLRREIGPEGDLQEAYRKWYQEEMLRHDEMLENLVRKFNQRNKNTSPPNNSPAENEPTVQRPREA